MTIYVFDMDGTLTPARKVMTEDFAKAFLPWLNSLRQNCAASVSDDFSWDLRLSFDAGGHCARQGEKRRKAPKWRTDRRYEVGSR